MIPIVGAIHYDLPSLRYIYMCVLIVLVIIGLINNIFSLMTLLRDRIRSTICGIYLIMYSTCSFILMILLLTNIGIVMYYNEYLIRLWACHGYPYLSLTMVYTSILISVAFAIEGVLTKCFKFDKFRSKKSAILNSLSFIFIVSISNLDKIFARNLILDQSGNFHCLYEQYAYKSWSMILFFIYIILPCIIHFICIICILCKSTEENCIHRIFRHQHHLIPSFLIILCLFLHGSYRYLLNFSMINSSKYFIRLHIAFILLLYMPQILTCLIYITTNDFYVKEFYQIWFYRKLCCCFYNRKRHVQEFAVIHNLWQRRTSLETIKTISNLDDTCMESEFYKK
ncbi:hypothetical protein I4U23_007126 [Adineta vaga]|nr:hypothetical protein I4U23_007126 [Adineta vaga]